MNRVIEMKVSPTGEVTVQTKGYTGNTCIQASIPGADPRLVPYRNQDGRILSGQPHRATHPTAITWIHQRSTPRKSSFPGGFCFPNHERNTS